MTASSPVADLARQQLNFKAVVEATASALGGIVSAENGVDRALDALQQAAWAAHDRMAEQRARFARTVGLLTVWFAPQDDACAADLSAALDMTERGALPPSAPEDCGAHVIAYEDHVMRQALAEQASEDAKQETAPLALPAAPEEVTAAANKPVERPAYEAPLASADPVIAGKSLENMTRNDDAGRGVVHTKEVQAEAAAREASPEERVRAAHPTAMEQHKDAKGGVKFRIVKPIADGVKPLTAWCSTPETAWATAAAKIKT